MLAAVLSALIAGGPAVPPPAPVAVRAVPDEPGATFLPEVQTYQAVAADLDGDGARDVLRTVAAERGAIDAEAWTETDAGWEPLGTPVRVNPPRPTGDQGDIIYAGTPVRLVVRRIGRGERVTLVRQPTFRDAGAETGCCLLLHDVVLADGGLRLVAVADPGPTVDAVYAIDFDGDAVDELLASRSLQRRGAVTFPIEARVFRWTGAAFGTPTTTELPVGSVDAPFVLGESDGVPGDEAAVIRSGSQPTLLRLRLTDGDALAIDDAGLVANDALGVTTDDGPALAVVGPAVGVAIVPWPAGASAGEPIAQLELSEDADLLGVVEVLGEARLVVHDHAPEALHLLTLPTLGQTGFTVTRSPTAAAFAGSPVRPYVGTLPGGGLDGEPAILYAGRFLPSVDLPDAPFATRDSALFATLSGAQPLGLVGRDRGWLAILHAPLPFERLDPVGGRLDAPIFQPGSGVSVSPIELAREPERDDGALDPVLLDAAVLPSGEVAVGPRGFTARVDAPPGSRVYVSDLDPSVVGPIVVVPDSGTVRLTLASPVDATTNQGFRTGISVVTPSGHGYVAGWEVRLLVAPPELEAAIATRPGSTAVDVSGHTAPHAEVTVAGERVEVSSDGSFGASVDLPPWPTDVRVVAVDPVGNQASMTLSGVGILDYRGLPWPAIALGLVALVAVVLFLRVPRVRRAVERADDAVLEEIDSD